MLGTGATLDDNVTASLWMTVRDGSMGVKNMICPYAPDQPDRLTDDGTDAGVPVALADTYDFANQSNLSYSTINMYHSAVGKAWNAAVRPDWVIAADNNSNDYGGTPARHTLGPAAVQADVQLAENSGNHPKREGQNILFGDGHVEFILTPFAGPSDDNVYAMTLGGKNAPPTLGHDDGDAAKDPAVARQDVVLLPLSGNGGGAGSLNPDD